jgi:hypothetical protein
MYRVHEFKGGVVVVITLARLLQAIGAAVVCLSITAAGSHMKRIERSTVQPSGRANSLQYKHNLQNVILPFVRLLHPD